MSGTTTALRVCPGTDHREDFNQVPAEEILRRLHEEVDACLDQLAETVHEGNAKVLINQLTHCLTGRDRRKRNKTNMLNRLGLAGGHSEPRDTIRLTVGVKEYRTMLLKRGGCKCAFCGKKIVSKTATIDHVQPISRGGDNTPDNLILSCKSCNTTKSDRTIEEWANDILAARGIRHVD